MSYSTSPKFGPQETPKAIKILLLLLGVIPLISAFYSAWSPILGPQEILSLSRWGIQHFFIWQVLTYPLVLELYAGISIGFFIELFFSVYLTWIVGSTLYSYLGQKRFFRFYLGTIFITGILTTGSILLFNSPLPFSGPAPLLYSLLILWCMLNPELELLLFMTFPVKAKWLVVSMLGIIFLVSLGQGQWVPVVAYLSSSLCSYFYGTLFCSLSTPFSYLKKVDEKLILLGHRLREKAKPISMETDYPDAKIFDLKTGQAVIDDDSFMDSMLEKISKSGEQSLSKKEKKRMQKISKQKNN